MKGLVDTSRPSLIEGYAIVSADCMISDAGGTMDALKFVSGSFWPGWMPPLPWCTAVILPRAGSGQRTAIG